MVSNAAKFAPHEGRGRHLTSAHADAIASLLFPQENNKNRKRKLFRHLRSSLNEANQHLPDRYLALGRADELQLHQITAGYLSKSRKALLNIPPRTTPDAEPNEDALRRRGPRTSARARAPGRDRPPARAGAVRSGRVGAGVAGPRAAAVTTTTTTDGRMVDDGERTLLESTYRKAVLELAKKVKDRQLEVKELLQALSIVVDDQEELFDVSRTPSDAVVAVDVSPSQGRTFPVTALLVLLFNDTIEALSEDQQAAGAADADAD